MAPDPRSVRSVFDEASEITDPRQRAAFLARACTADDALRTKVEVLLAAHEEAGGFLADFPSDQRPAPARHAPDALERIGPYTLLQEIGEGGCGVVYLAEQVSPLRRQVALKIIKQGMDTRQVVARFEAERQALALMDHPHIAKVLDAGTTKTGRPYFVMEMVRGLRITDFCELNQLATTQRLELFIKVCQAIQHAHQKGIIHRDLKPSNILVTPEEPGSSGAPKVIDFGIAKAMSEPLTDETVFTAFEQFIGTPAYMSPEQAEMGGLDIDTRSDIYSLGVLLYELLTGSTPFDATELQVSGIDAMRKTIREKEPMRPSTRLATLGANQLTATAKRRSADTSTLMHQIRGDLDWIVMKCLEKDRNRRYETANGLAMDIRRHLDNEPVVARPPTIAYKFQKAWRRNKLAITAAGVVAVSLVVGIGVSTWQAIVASRARTAETQQRLTAEAAEQAEKRQRQRAEAGEADARRLLYVASMNSAQRYWEQGNVGLLRQLLDETRESPSRGFEWYYWQRQAHLDLKSLRGHLGPVTSVAFSPDGHLIATGSEDQTAKVWEAASGKGLLTLKGHGARVNSVAFSPDGRRIATASHDGTAKVWAADSGKELLTLAGHGGRIWSVAFSPDGLWIATGSQDSTAKVWEVSTGKELLTLDGHGGAVRSLAFSADGRRIATGSDDRTAKVWEADSGKELLTLKGHSGQIWSVAFSPNGQRIATGSQDSTAKVWDASGGKELLSLKGQGAVRSLAFSPDGRGIVASGGDATARMWDVASGKELLTLKGHSGGVSSVAFSPDGQRVATGGDDASAKVWDASGKAMLTLQGHGGGISSVAFSADGGRIVTGSEDDTAKVWDAGSGRELLALRGHSGGVSSVAFSADGRRIVTGSRDATAKVWDAGSGRELLALKGHGGAIWSVAFSPDGLRVATGSGDATAKVWDVASGRDLLTLRGHGESLRSVAFTPDGRRIATGSDDRTARVWDAAGGKELLTLKGHDGVVNSVGFSPDGRRIVTTSNDKTAKVWDAAGGKELLTLKGHGDLVFSVAFSPDGQRIVTSSMDATAKVWELASGKELLTIGHGRAFWAAAFSPDGRQIATGGPDAVAEVWAAATDVQVATWRAEEQAAEQQLALLRPVAEAEARAAAEARARELAALAGAPGSAPGHRLSTQERPVIPSDPGVIRQWLVLAPIPFDGGPDLNVLRQQIPN
ncbi:MAG TPA: protein kinase [Dongiaceae bacterium]|nr:protein kinase [Dongiaceae bacterium]